MGVSLMSQALRVLIVDDDDDDWLLVRSYFEEMSAPGEIHIDHAKTSTEALQLFHENQYDLALFDYQLGACTGLELFRTVRTEGVRTPIVFLTGQGNEEVAAEVIKAGATDYLPKSKLNKTTLLQKINQALEFRRAEDSRLKAEERLQNSELQFRALFDSSLDAILIMDSQGRFIDASSSACELVGLEKSALLGKSPDDFTLPSYGFRALWQSFLEKGWCKTEFSLQRSDGSIAELEISARANFLPGKHLAIARDVTDEKLAEHDRLKLEQQLRQAQKMEAVGHLAGGIAHDFNNLLMVITSHAELIIRKLPKIDSIPATVETMIGACEKAGSLTEQLLAFSRQQVMAPKVFDLNHEVVKMKTLLKPVLGEDLELRTVLASGLGRVKADPGQIQQVILNLTVNARDSMPNGGRLTISTANQDVDPSYARQHVGMKLGQYVILSVTDNGAGMNAATQSRIFEPFFTTKEVGKGTGLGLATVYGIVQQSGGYIAVSSKLGTGTTFTVYLPKTEEEPESADAAPVVHADSGCKTIMLVEDERDLLRSLSDLLQAHGYRVVPATNGIEAKELLQDVKHQIDLLITDVVMPGMGGDDLAALVRQTHPGMKILFMSGGTLRLVSEVKLPTGTKLLNKPFTGKALIEKIQQLLCEQSVAALAT
jgi:two-component system cell cycle sensor histidine kinase/response regulator CckA